MKEFQLAIITLILVLIECCIIQTNNNIYVISLIIFLYILYLLVYFNKHHLLTYDRYRVKLTPYVLSLIKEYYYDHDNYCFIYIKKNRKSTWQPAYINIINGVIYYEAYNGMHELQDIDYISDIYGYYKHKVNTMYNTIKLKSINDL